MKNSLPAVFGKGAITTARWKGTSGNPLEKFFRGKMTSRGVFLLEMTYPKKRDSTIKPQNAVIQESRFPKNDKPPSVEKREGKFEAGC